MKLLKLALALFVSVPLGVVILAQGCAQFSSGECTDKALCDLSEASTSDNTSGDAPADVIADTVVKPDGPVPDGECNGGAENCSNGIDDNCNGLIDCADPVCQSAGYVCTAPPPTGWTLVGLDSVAGSAPPACGGLYTTTTATGNTGLTASAAMCGCSCSNPPINVSCSGGVNINYYTDACATGAGGAGLPANFCVNTGGSSVTHCKGTTNPTGYNGDCTATPSKTVPAISWSNAYAACGYAAPKDMGGCAQGGQCVGSPPSTFWAKPCVYQVGDVACPGVPYTLKTTFDTSVSDNRSCATCTCTASAGTCSATISTYSATQCAMGVGSLVASIPTDGACYACNGAYSAIAPTVTTNPGTCGNGGTGGPIGSASGASPVTVCCTP